MRTLAMSHCKLFASHNWQTSALGLDMHLFFLDLAPRQLDTASRMPGLVSCLTGVVTYRHVLHAERMRILPSAVPCVESNVEI